MLKRCGGGYHTIALRIDGAVRCWGGNQYGQCTVPADLGTCSKVACGWSHTIALRSDGIVRSWGYNPDGQCNTPSDLGKCSDVAGGLGNSIAIAGPRCIADLFIDGQVNGADLGILLGQWGEMGSADLDANGVVNGADLGMMLGAWGQCAVTIPSWATLVEAQPDPLVVTDAAKRAAITESGLPWRVRDTATQIEMLLIPPGTFLMGDANWASPVHTVTLTNAFYMGRHEVKQWQWVASMGSNPSYNSGYGGSVPVESVSWTTIQGFLSVTGMRLPSEAEWEYAYRAGTTTTFYNGSSEANIGTIAWYSANSGNLPHPSGGKAANALGLYDMSGNVWEWVKDWSGSYSAGAQVNPTGPASGTTRVYRGGSYTSGYTRYLSSSYRGYNSPSNASYMIGFRVARTP